MKGRDKKINVRGEKEEREEWGKQKKKKGKGHRMNKVKT